MKLLSIAMILGALLLASGCETMEGLGKDIQKAGKALEQEAKD